MTVASPDSTTAQSGTSSQPTATLVQETGSPAGPVDLLSLSYLSRDEVYGALNTCAAGLTDQEATIRLRNAGPNRLNALPGPSLIRRFLQQFTHLFAVLLWVGSLLAFGVSMPALGVAIVAVIILNGVFGFVQEYRAGKAVEALKRLLPPEASVIRGGAEARISAEELVPGDVLILREGDKVSADARLVQISDLRTDDSSLTGESHPTHKTSQAAPETERTVIHARNMVFAGSMISSGEATAVVAATGMSTEFGRIAALTQQVEPKPSPLQIQVRRVAQQVAVLSIAMGVGFFFIGYYFAGLTLRDGALFGIGIVLANVPEGLLPTMTLSLAMGVQRMARRNAIVKSLSSVETLGSCTTICTDKTGTITKNQMTVREIWSGGQSAIVSGSGYEPAGGFFVDDRLAGLRTLTPFLPLLRTAHLCNAARLDRSNGDGHPWVIHGDPTEGALLVVAAKAGLNRDDDLRSCPLVRSLAFNPRRKRMSTIHYQTNHDPHLLLHVKGAPRELLEYCDRIVMDGREVPLTADLAASVMEVNDRMARDGLRVLGMASRILPLNLRERVNELSPGEVEEHMLLLGLVGMQDPPRDEVPAAVQRCRKAGIRVIMITGDYGLTAESIAGQVGLIDAGEYRLVEGGELDSLSEDDLRGILASGQVLFARMAPEQKLRVVSALREMGETVAVTGDGVNDAPALKQADIGVAMGVAGTDVAREAADMILADDNFATIVAAIEEGRAIFDNMRKFIVYIFAHLSPEAIPYIAFALFPVPLPLTVMQILAIDLGTETLPALALGVEPPEPDVMARSPRRRDARLLDAGALLRGYGFLGLMTASVVLGTFFLYLFSHGWVWGDRGAPADAAAGATTVVFFGIVLMQVGNAFACRTERVSVFRIGLQSNRLLLWGIGFELVLTSFLIYEPGMQTLFGTTALGWQWWLILAAFIPVIFLAEEGRKALARHRAAD